jgi:hypothetical protein
MSALLMGMVWRLELSRSQRVVALALADHADDDGGHIYPGIEYLAWKTDYDARQVRRILRSLEDIKLIVPVAFTSGGRGHATEYQMNVYAVPAKAPYQKISTQPDDDGDKGGHFAPEHHDKGGHFVAPVTNVPLSSAGKADIPSVKADISLPQRRTFPHTKADIPSVKADIPSVKADIPNVKADIAMSPQPSRNIKRNIIEPSGKPRALSREPVSAVSFVTTVGCEAAAAPPRQVPLCPPVVSSDDAYYARLNASRGWIEEFNMACNRARSRRQGYGRA